MADVRLNIASREYIVTCRDGEEMHLQSLAAMVDEMAHEAGGATGGLNESRQLLFAALLLADKLHDAKSNALATVKPASESRSSDEIQVIQAAATMERLADRLEVFAVKLEN